MRREFEASAAIFDPTGKFRTHSNASMIVQLQKHHRAVSAPVLDERRHEKIDGRLR